MLFFTMEHKGNWNKHNEKAINSSKRSNTAMQKTRKMLNNSLLSLCRGGFPIQKYAFLL